MNTKSILGVIIGITLVTAFSGGNLILQQQQAEGYSVRCAEDAPMAASGDNVYVVWWSNKTGKFEVQFRASTDGGQTFGDKINLSNSTQGESLEGTVAASGDNNVIVTYLDNKTGNVETYIRTSTDNGATFGPPMMVNGTFTEPRNLNLLGHKSLGIDIFEEAEEKTQTASSGDNVYSLSWDKGPGSWDVFFTRSTDGGLTFGNATNLSNNPDTNSDRAIMLAEEDNVYITWWETAKGNQSTPVMRVSNDNGETFGPVLSLSANGTIGEAAEEGTEEGE